MTVATPDEMRDQLREMVLEMRDHGVRPEAAKQFRLLRSDYLRAILPDPDTQTEEPNGYCHLTGCGKRIEGRTARALYCSQYHWRVANWQREKRKQQAAA